MNFQKIVILFINTFDYCNTKKIYEFLSKKIKKDPVILDVGAHYGETIKLVKKFFHKPEIHSFEISNKNFNVLKKVLKRKKYKKVFIYNYGFSNFDGISKYFQAKETSSTTISKINEKSKYLKKKLLILGKKNFKNFYKIDECKLKTVDTFCNENKIGNIDLLKIDTEGHEMQILKGSINSLKKIKFVFFEHHYDDMIIKGYKFSDINEFLKFNNFKMIYKSKMFFRKTFEYIYINKNFD